jgi:hypothetical protein
LCQIKVSGKQTEVAAANIKRAKHWCRKIKFTYTAVTAAIDGQVSKLIFSQDN